MALECFSEAENPLLKLKSVPNLLQQDITDSISKLTEHQVSSTKIQNLFFLFLGWNTLFFLKNKLYITQTQKISKSFFSSSKFS